MSDTPRIDTLATGLAAIILSPVYEDNYSISRIQNGFNIRSDLGDDHSLRELGESMKSGQLQPIGVTVGGRPIWGGRRIAAARLVGMTTLKAMVYPDSITELQILAAQAVENLQRAEMSEADTYRACVRLKEAGLSGKSIAEAIQKTPSALTKYLSPDNVPPEVRQAFLESRLTLGQCYKISSSSDPLATMRLFLNGATREQVEAEIKKPPAPPAARAPPPADTVKLDKVLIAIYRAQVIVKAKREKEGLNLAATRTALLAAIAKVDEAIERNYCAATAQKAWLDSSKKAPSEKPEKKGGRKAAKEVTNGTA